MKLFWPIVCGTLVATFFVTRVVVAIWAPGISYRSTMLQRYLVAFPVTVVLVGVVWAILCRPQLERGRVSLAAIFLLVTIQAIGLWFAQFMLSLDSPR
jgi:hypothetical protein